MTDCHYTDDKLVSQPLDHRNVVNKNTTQRTVFSITSV